MIVLSLNLECLSSLFRHSPSFHGCWTRRHLSFDSLTQERSQICVTGMKAYLCFLLLLGLSLSLCSSGSSIKAVCVQLCANACTLCANKFISRLAPCEHKS